jgi:hypothetical protein
MNYTPALAAHGVLTEYPFDLRAAYPECAFPPDIEPHNLTAEMKGDGVVLVEMTDPPLGDFTSITPGAPTLIGGKWRTTWVTTERTLDAWKDELKNRVAAGRLR